MATQILKDKYGSKIGEIRDNGSVQTIHDKYGSLESIDQVQTQLMTNMDQKLDLATY